MKLIFSSLFLFSSFFLNAESILIRNVNILESTGMEENVSILITNGVIESIDSLIFTEATEEIDGTGRTVTAGLFNGETHIGAVEVGAIDSTVDYRTNNGSITASFKPSESFNPHSTLIPHNRTHGLTQALLVPEAETHMIAGQVAVIELGNTPKILNDSFGVAMDFTEHGISIMGGSRSSALAKLRIALDDAKDFSRNRKSALRGEHRAYDLSYADLYALQPVVEGIKPIIVRVHRSIDIVSIINLAKEFQLDLILSGVAEGWMVAEQIAESKAPVIMDPIYNLPTAFEHLGARLENASILYEKGVQLIFTGMGWHNTHSAYLVRQSAGNAVANGLPKTASIAAITSNPAEIFKLDYSGNIREGEVANLVLWNGDPFELTAEAEMVMIAGEKIEMTSRSLQLRDRYYKNMRNFIETESGGE